MRGPAKAGLAPSLTPKRSNGESKVTVRANRYASARRSDFCPGRMAQFCAHDGTFGAPPRYANGKNLKSRFGRHPMNGLIYLVGLIVVIMFVLSLLGLR